MGSPAPAGEGSPVASVATNTSPGLRPPTRRGTELVMLAFAAGIVTLALILVELNQERSLSLGILNLLPIPLLDGGHLLYYLIELVKGSPLSERAMAAGQYVGLALLAGLMGLAFYNDIVNNFVR